MSVQFFLTNAGRQAAINAAANSITIVLDKIAVGTGKYDASTQAAGMGGLVAQVAAYPLNSGALVGQTLQVSAMIDAQMTADIYEIGVFLKDGTLFAIASTTGNDPLLKLVNDISSVISLGVALGDLDGRNITVSIDNSGPIAQVLLNQHLAADDPHPQYLKKAGATGSAADLVARIEALERRKIEPISIGGLLITTNNYADSAAVRAGEGYGRWKRYAKGQTLIGATDYQLIQPQDDNAPYARLGEPDANGEARWFITGSKAGEYQHRLSVDEMPSHDHSVTVAATDDSGGHYFTNGGFNGTEADLLKVGAAGGNVAHNTIQPSIVVGIWQRMPDDWAEEAYTEPASPYDGTEVTPPAPPSYFSLSWNPVRDTGNEAGYGFSTFFQSTDLGSANPINTPFGKIVQLYFWDNTVSGNFGQGNVTYDGDPIKVDMLFDHDPIAAQDYKSLLYIAVDHINATLTPYMGENGSVYVLEYQSNGKLAVDVSGRLGPTAYWSIIYANLQNSREANNSLSAYLVNQAKAGATIAVKISDQPIP